MSIYDKQFITGFEGMTATQANLISTFEQQRTAVQTDLQELLQYMSPEKVHYESDGNLSNSTRNTIHQYFQKCVELDGAMGEYCVTEGISKSETLFEESGINLTQITKYAEQVGYNVYEQ